MDQLVGFTICIETTDSFMKIGPMFTDGAITNSIIKDAIRSVLTENNQTENSASDIEEIIVIGIGDTFSMMLTPKIEDVWPFEFGPKNDTWDYWKGGDKN